jgi:hypothetical protein
MFRYTDDEAAVKKKVRRERYTNDITVSDIDFWKYSERSRERFFVLPSSDLLLRLLPSSEDVI